MSQQHEQHDAQPLTLEMKVASRKIHNLANASLNLKLVVLLSDKLLYARAIACFYSVFKTLEECTKSARGELKSVQKLLPTLARTAALTADLQHYLGCVAILVVTVVHKTTATATLSGY